MLAELRAGVARLANPVMFPVEVRVAAADDIWLSTAYGRDSAYVAIHQYVGLPYQEYFKLFESIAGSAGGRPHWGKMHIRDAAYLGAAYPRFADFLQGPRRDRPVAACSPTPTWSRSSGPEGPRRRTPGSSWSVTGRGQP